MDQQDDRRRQPQARVGPLTQLLAEAGWLVCGVLGLVVMIMLAALVSGSAAALLGWFAVLAPIGVIGGTLGGLVAQNEARSRLLGPAAATGRRAAREVAAKTTWTAIPGHSLRPYGRWARFYEACARSVARYHDIVNTLSGGPGRDWLARIGETLDAELAEALRLARLGESLEPDELTAPGETVYQVLERLRAAKQSFAETTERAAAIALDLREDSDFVHIRAQLDMLAEQVPQLRQLGA
jgi:hypothetical protein